MRAFIIQPFQGTEVYATNPHLGARLYSCYFHEKWTHIIVSTIVIDGWTIFCNLFDGLSDRNSSKRLKSLHIIAKQ